jgi:uncharacterized membrane protein YdjX (TVP38/TMEM64 family)
VADAGATSAREEVTTMSEPQAEGAAASAPPAPPSTVAATPRRRSSWWWKLPLATVGLALVLLALRQLGGPVLRFVTWVDGLGAAAGAVFVVGYALAAVALLPGSVLTLAAGAIFGLWRGTLYTFVGATLGACLAFLIARYLARRAVERRLQANPRFAAIDRAVGREGGKIVLLLRLSPVFPYNLLNYALGLTRVRFRDYALASLGMLPGTLLYVYYGKVIGDVAALAAGVEVEKGAAGWLTLGVGLLATVAVTAYVTRIARRALAAQGAAEEVVDGRS